MRLLAWTLIIVSLVFAIVSAVTAYLPRTTLADGNFVARDDDGSEQPLTLGAPAGKHVVDGKPEPLAKSGEKLTPELLARLRAGEQNRVRVKEFSFSRWSEWWIFALGCLGMLGGAMLIRRENARQAVLGAEGRVDSGGSAESELAALRAGLADLRKEIAATTDGSRRLQLIVDRAERMTSDHVPPFIAARPPLVARLGLAGYAQLMDRFAAGERQLNRAWSAAADGYEEEAVQCLDNASMLFDEAGQRMR
jgi:hypothetical protein